MSENGVETQLLLIEINGTFNVNSFEENYLKEGNKIEENGEGIKGEEREKER